MPRYIPDVVDAHIRYSHGNNLCENVYQFTYNQVPNSTQLNILAAELALSVGEKMRLAMSDNVIMREVHCVDIGAPGRQTGSYTWPNNTRGARAGSQLASNEAVSATLRTGYTGRRNKGRKSFSEFVEGDIDGNTVGNTLMALIADIGIAILADRAGGLFAPVVASLLYQSKARIRAFVIPDDNVDSQKTRLNNRGR